MTALVVNGFTGMAPRFASRLLADSQASFAANLKATNGDFRGFRGLQLLEPLPVNAQIWRRAKKFYYPDSDLYRWWCHTNPLADAVDSPLSSDAFNRVYISSPGAPIQVTTLDDMGTGTPPINLGLARPTVAPTVTATGGSGANDTRAYSYTTVSAYGETSPPAPPALVSGKMDGTWTIVIPSPLDAHAVWVDIYRSQPGNVSAGNYYRVGRIEVSAGSFVDSMQADFVSLLPALDTFGNDPPNPAYYGLVTHSSGALVAFTGRTVAFTRPYLPHAWPEEYRYTVEHQVVGLAVVDNAVVVMTKGHPVIIAGNTPDSVAIINITDREPCLSKRSIVVIDNTVYYASANGLISVNTGGIGRPTVEILTSEEWDDYSPQTLEAAKYNQQYVGFTGPNTGLVISLKPYETPAIVVLDRYDQITGIEVDDRTADVVLIKENKAFKFDTVDDRRFAVTWRSKEFITPKPMNFGAYQVIFAKFIEVAGDNPLAASAVEYNQRRFAAGPLDGIGFSAIGGPLVLDAPVAPPTDPALHPAPVGAIGGSPLFDPNVFEAAKTIRFTLIADDVVRYSQFVDDERVHKLPSSYKSTHHFIEISGSNEVARIVVAETAKECARA